MIIFVLILVKLFVMEDKSQWSVRQEILAITNS